MSTIIDALVVTLGLDTTGFKKGKTEAEKGLKDTEGAATKSAKEAEARAKMAGQFLGDLRNKALALAATFTAGVGLKNFVENITVADAAVGRTAKNIGVSTEMLTAWQGVAERAGGSAAGITGSMQGLSQQFQQLALTGTSSVVPYFRAIGVSIADSSGKMRPMKDILLDVSDQLSKMDPARAQAIGRGLGLDEGTVNVLIKGRAALTAYLAEQEKLGHANKADADAAAKREAQWKAVTQASQDLGRKLLTTLTPAIEMVLRGLIGIAEWFSEHRTVFTILAGAVTAAAATLTVALQVLALRGLGSVIAALWKVVPASIAATNALLGASAATSVGLVKILAGLASSAALVAAAGAVGYAIGSVIYSMIEDTVSADKIGGFIARTLAAFGNKDAKKAVEQREKYENEQLKNKRTSVGKIGGVAPESKKTSPETLASNAEPRKGQREQVAGDVKRLMEFGWTREQATGIVANIQAESGGKTDIVGDKGKAYGLAQWHPDRQADFEKLFGKKIQLSTRDEQLQFLNHELREGREKSAGNALSKTSNAADAAEVMTRKFERPAKPDEDSAKRRAIATAIYRSGPAPDPAMQGGAGTALAAAAPVANHNDNRQSSSEVKIGAVNVTLPNVTDATDVAKGLPDAMKKQFSLAAQANYGLL